MTILLVLMIGVFIGVTGTCFAVYKLAYTEDKRLQAEYEDWVMENFVNPNQVPLTPVQQIACDTQLKRIEEELTAFVKQEVKKEVSRKRWGQK